MKANLLGKTKTGHHHHHHHPHQQKPHGAGERLCHGIALERGGEQVFRVPLVGELLPRALSLRFMRVVVSPLVVSPRLGTTSQPRQIPLRGGSCSQACHGYFARDSSDAVVVHAQVPD